jgi:hypothetical protein
VLAAAQSVADLEHESQKPSASVASLSELKAGSAPLIKIIEADQEADSGKVRAFKASATPKK